MKPSAFRNKVVVLTGASSGIGREMARMLGAMNAEVVAVDRRGELLKTLQTDVPQLLCLVGDIRDEAFCRQVVDAAIAHFGRIDILINNAGVSMNALFADTGSEVFRHLMDVNYFGPLYLARFAFPALRQSRGRLYFISSVVGKRGFPTRSGYSAAKFAVQGLFECLRAEWSDYGISVGIVSPGFTDTEIRRTAFNADGSERGVDGKTAGRIMSAEEAARRILSAIAGKRREVILSSGGRLMVWINKLVPRLADRLVTKVMV